MSRSPAITILERARVVHAGGVVSRPLAFADGAIESVGTGTGGFRLDLRDHLVFPGLINAHDHLQLNCIPRLPHERPFANSYEWISAYDAFRAMPAVAEAVRRAKELRHRHGGFKNILAGATTVAHHDPPDPSFDDPDFPVDVPRGLAWSHSLGLGAASAGSAAKYGPPVRESFLNSAGRPWVVHAAEGTDDVARVEISRLDDMGCLASNTVIVHGLGMTDHDVDRVIEVGASVVWCPASNLELFGRTLDPRRLVAAGRLALGTDSRLTGSRDILDELAIAAANSDLRPAELFALVTSAARDTFRLPPSGFGPGERKASADCLILREPMEDPFRALVGATRADVRAVVRRGAPVIADPDFADWFAACGVDPVPVLLDGRRKLLARHLAGADLLALEPNLEIC